MTCLTCLYCLTTRWLNDSFGLGVCCWALNSGLYLRGESAAWGRPSWQCSSFYGEQEEHLTAERDSYYRQRQAEVTHKRIRGSSSSPILHVLTMATNIRSPWRWSDLRDSADVNVSHWWYSFIYCFFVVTENWFHHFFIINKSTSLCLCLLTSKPPFRASLSLMPFGFYSPTDPHTLSQIKSGPVQIQYHHIDPGWSNHQKTDTGYHFPTLQVLNRPYLYFVFLFTKSKCAAVLI